MTRVEMKCLLAKINGKQLKWTGDNGSANADKVVDVFVLANLSKGIVFKALDPDEFRAKGWKSIGEYEPDDPRHCVSYRKFHIEGGYDEAEAEGDAAWIDAVAHMARRIDAQDPDTPVCFAEIRGAHHGGSGPAICPMF
jgi:hypothetical protein